MLARLTVLAGLSAAASVATAPASSAPDLLSGYRWKARLLVVVAATEEDPRVAEQRRLFMDARQASRERDLILVERTGPTPDADALRDRFGVPANAFRAVLVGKDGDDKLESAEPIAPERLFSQIDTMPMRRDEMRREDMRRDDDRRDEMRREQAREDARRDDARRDDARRQRR